MLGFAWLLHRQAQEALKNGRLEDAQRILAQPNARDQKGHAELAAKLAQAALILDPTCFAKGRGKW